LNQSTQPHELVIVTMEVTKRLVHEQASARARANPGSSWGLIVDLEVGAARDRLLRLSDELRAEGDPTGAALVAALIENWLPVLAQELRGHA
jgi:hypothetical protein